MAAEILLRRSAAAVKDAAGSKLAPKIKKSAPKRADFLCAEKVVSDLSVALFD
jgi:hypothetical protein